MEMMSKRRALGRGLGALIPGTYADRMEERSGALVVAVSEIQPNPLQPRRRFADPAIDELAASIREKGILQPLLVRRANGGYEIIAGERRFRAAQRLGLDQVPVVIRDAADTELLEMALIENIQRENLSPLEEAHAYRRLIDEFRLTQEEVANRVGKDRSTIANMLRLLQLPEEVQAAIEDGSLSPGHARALITVPSEEAKVSLAREVIAQRLNVRQTERLAKDRSEDSTVDLDQQAVEQRLMAALGTRVRLKRGRNGNGRIEIEYYSLAELNGLIDRLTEVEVGA